MSMTDQLMALAGTYVDHRTLKNHAASQQVYGDEGLVDEDLLASIQTNGVLEPLIVAADKTTVISGHRRRFHAIRAGLKTVPVLTLATDDPFTLVDRIVAYNRHREKTAEQKAREAALLVKNEADRALARKQATQAKDGKIPTNSRSGLSSASPEDAAEPKGKAVEMAAEKLESSPDTVRKQVAVVNAIDQAEAAGDKAKADDIRETLNKQSVNAAHQKATGKKPGKKTEEPIVPGQPICPAHDIFGNRVDGSLSTVFDEGADKFKDLLRTLKDCRKQFKELKQHPAGSRLIIDSPEHDLKQAENAIKIFAPYCICPNTKAKSHDDCDTCHGRGWITKDDYARLPEQHKAFGAAK